MDLNVKVKIDSPDIMNALLAIAEALPQKKQESIKVKEIDQEEKEVKQETKAVALEEVRTKLTNLSQNGKQTEVKASIKKYGAIKLTTISLENYADLLKEAEII